MREFISKNWLIFLVLIIMAISCIINIAFSAFTDSHTNLFTAISGCISGIATIILGLITVWQSKRYKEQNDKNNIISNFKYEFNRMDELYNKYIENYDSSILLYNIDSYRETHSRIYFDKITYFQINLSKSIAVIVSKFAAQTYFKKSNLTKFMTDYYDKCIEKRKNILIISLLRKMLMN